jgi:fumarate reductase subunit D
MNLARNFVDLSKTPVSKTRNLVTTISGIIMLIIQIVVSVGWINSEQGLHLQEIAGGAITAVVQLVGYVSAVILMFKAEDA